MMTTRGASGRAVLSSAQQVSLSVLGTLAATVVVTALRSEWAVRPAAQQSATAQQTVWAAPSLTTGRKFAARAITGNDPEPFVIVTTLPPMLPLFTAAALPPLTSAEATPRPFTATLTATIAPEPLVRIAPVSSRHSRPHATAGAPLPPYREAPAQIAMAPLPHLSSPGGEETSFWTRSRSVYRQVADWSDEIVDRLLP